MKYLLDKNGEGRVPTFFTYVFGKVDGQGELPLTCQGPHTIAHRYIMEYVDRKYWTDLFVEQIEPYPPDVIVMILESEGIGAFKNQQRYLYDYKQLYAQLYAWKECGVLSSIDKGIIKENDMLYHVVRNSIVCIMEMHPYGSYGWNRESQKHILKCEIAGKSERIIDLDQKDEQAEVIVDTHAWFQLSEAYKEFICIRLERYSEEEKKDIVSNWDTVVQNTILQEYENLVQALRDKVEEACKSSERRIICEVMSVSLLQAYHYLLKNGRYNFQLKGVYEALWEVILLKRYHGLPKGLKVLVWKAGRERGREEDIKIMSLKIPENFHLEELVGDIVGEFNKAEMVQEEQEQEEEREEEQGAEEETQVFDGLLSLMDALNLYLSLYGDKEGEISRAVLIQIRKALLSQGINDREALVERLRGQWKLEEKIRFIEIPEEIERISVEEWLKMEQEEKAICIFYYSGEDIYSAGIEKMSQVLLQKKSSEDIILSLISTLASAVGQAMDDKEKLVIKAEVECKAENERFLNKYVEYAKEALSISYTVQVWREEKFLFECEGAEKVLMIQYDEENMFQFKNRYSSKNRNRIVYQFEQQCMEKGFGMIGASYLPLHRIRKQCDLLPGEAMCPTSSVISSMRKEFNIYAGIVIRGLEGNTLTLPGEEGLEILEIDLPWFDLKKLDFAAFQELVLPFPDDLIPSIAEAAGWAPLDDRTAIDIYSELKTLPEKWLKDNMHVISIIRKHIEITNTIVIYSSQSPTRVYTGDLKLPTVILVENNGVYQYGTELNIGSDIECTNTVSAENTAIADMGADTLKSLSRWQMGIGYYSLTTLIYAILRAGGKEIDCEVQKGILNFGIAMCKTFRISELFISYNEQNVSYIKEKIGIQNTIALIGKDYDGQEKEEIPGDASLKRLCIKYENLHYEVAEE